MRQVWADYCRAYVDCSDWLAAWFLPWRWVVGFAREAAELRRNTPREG